MGRVKRKNTEGRFAYALLFPSLLLLVLLIGYPMLYNIVISFQKVPLNPRLGSEFIGLANYAEVLQDKTFYHSVLITLLFTVVVTVLSTILGLIIAIFMNREFVGKNWSTPLSSSHMLFRRCA